MVTPYLRGPRRPCLLKPSSETTNLRCKTSQSPNGLNAEPLENICLDRTDQEEIGSNATTSEEKAGAYVCRKSRRLIANLSVSHSVVELHAEKYSDRRHQASQKVVQHTFLANIPLAADAEVDEALVYHFNETYCLKNSSWTVDILPGVMCTSSRSSENTENTSFYEAVVPSRVGCAALPAQEEVLSCVAHMVPAAKGDARVHSKKVC